MGFGPVKGPDGKMWVSVTIMLGIASFTFGVPADQGLDFLKDFSENFRTVQAECMRIGGGLVIATAVPEQPPVPPGGNVNGYRVR